MAPPIARPLAQEGYHVVFQQFKDGLAADYAVFASGFAGGMTKSRGRRAPPRSDSRRARTARSYVGDDKGGRIWKIIYKAP